MIGKFLFVLLLAVLTSAEIPSYIKICGRKNPKLDECILNSVMHLKPKLLQGIPELDIPSINPLLLDSIDLVDLPSFKANAHNVKIYGFNKFNVENLHLDLDKKQIDTTVTFDSLKVEADYNVDAKVVVPVVGHGVIKLNAVGVRTKLNMLYKIVERNGKNYVYYYSITSKVDIADYTTNFKQEGETDSTLTNAINAALVGSKKEILEGTVPNIEKTISSTLLEINNKICKHFTYEELFPDRE